MKILVHSNAPHVATGYGVQTKQLVERLHDTGHQVAISSTYGLQGAIMPWSKRNIRMYPAGYAMNGVDVIHNHALHFFEGDALGGWIIPLLDVWCLLPNPMLRKFNVAAWTPIDHFPVPRDVRKFFEENPDAVPIAMSRFGERQLTEAGFAPMYVPLSVDTTVFKPTESIEAGGTTVTGRDLMGYELAIPDDAFVVGMVAMNKGWARDRKGFNEAFRAFGQFWQSHPEAILYVHAEASGQAEGIDLRELAIHCSVPSHAIRFADQYQYVVGGFSSQMMAAIYSAMDVLLAPSHGEGFGVPLVEAQACGTPVITSDFSANAELCGPGWLVTGQLEWDPAQHASYFCPYTPSVIRALEDAYSSDRGALAPEAVEFAAQYDCDEVFVRYWLPALEQLEQPPEELPLDREPMGSVAVIVPKMRDTTLLEQSFKNTNDGTARLVMVEGDDTFAEKVNRGLAMTSEPFVCIVGDDCEFIDGWIDAARKFSDKYDVIGTNDSSNGVKNPDVAAGRHADHFFVRRAYIDEYGACLDGPGVLAPEVYRHWFTDKEIIELAKARGVFTPCLDSVIEHHHPGYDGREDLRQADPVYMSAVEFSEEDRKTFQSRLPLIQMQRTSRGRR